MVTDKDGRRKIGYAIPYGWDGTILDTLVYDHVVKVNGKEQNGLRFLKAFFRSYISLNHTIDLDAPAYRKYLCETFIDKKRWNDDESRMLIINFLEGLWDDTTQQPKEYTISPDIRKGLYKVRVKIEGDLYYEYILKMEKRNEHFVITALNWKEENTSSDVEMPQNCDLEQLPQFPGGTDTLMAYLSKHIIYPKEEEKAGHEGRVIITFVVNRDGSISNAKVTRSAFKGLDEEALRVVRSMPAWEPGRIDGNPVPVSFSLPINFKLK